MSKDCVPGIVLLAIYDLRFTNKTDASESPNCKSSIVSLLILIALAYLLENRAQFLDLFAVPRPVPLPLGLNGPVVHFLRLPHQAERRLLLLPPRPAG